MFLTFSFIRLVHISFYRMMLFEVVSLIGKLVEPFDFQTDSNWTAKFDTHVRPHMSPRWVPPFGLVSQQSLPIFFSFILEVKCWKIHSLTPAVILCIALMIISLVFYRFGVRPACRGSSVNSIKFIKKYIYMKNGKQPFLLYGAVLRRTFPLI